MSQLRLHILGLPNAPITWDDEYSLCGFAAAGGRFCRMMKDLGHHVTVYGVEGTRISCDEFVPILSDETRKKLLGKTPYQHARIDWKMPLFQVSNANIIREFNKRKKPYDFLLSIGGRSQKPVFDGCLGTDIYGVEYSIGYVGNFAPYRVFESYAWMHTCYGEQRIMNGRFFDEVIPVFFDPAAFEFTAPEDYYLYVGRLIHEKGVNVACDAATAAGVKLKIIGHEGNHKLLRGGHEFLGAVDWRTRNEVMSKAKGVFCPTLYLEPFGCVAVEAQLCGTPVICTPWGGMIETVEHGKTGFHCHTLGDFVRAIRAVEKLDRGYVRKRAQEKYSMSVVQLQYEIYLRRLETLRYKGWDTL